MAERDTVFVNVQQLRALAAYMVVFVHLGPLLVPFALGDTFQRFAASGVDIFFVISGFIMVHTTRDARPGPGRFMRARLRRIVPLYWVLTFAVAAAAMTVPALFEQTRVTSEHLVKSLLFIPYLRADWTIRPLLFLGWSLNYEMFFYLIFAAGLGFSSYRRGIALVAAILCGLVAIGPFVASTSVYAAFYTRPVLLEFVAGMGLALALPVFAHRPVVPVLAALAMAAGFAGFVAAAVIADDSFAPLINLAAATAIVGGALVFECSGHRWTNAFGLAMGQASYSLYLSHPFATRLVTTTYDTLPPPGRVGSAFGIAIALLLATALGWLVFRWIEQPSARLARRLLPEPGDVRAIRT